MSTLLTVGLIGILSSLMTEFATYLNIRFQGTVLQGKGSFLLAFVIAFAGAFLKSFYDNGFHVVDLHSMVTYFTQVFTASQVFFIFIYQALGLDISSTRNEAVKYDQSLATG